MLPSRLAPLLGLAALAVAATSVHAKPAHKRALIEYFGAALPANLQACTTCHLPDRPDAADGEKPHNRFGARLAALRAERKKAGKKTDIIDCLESIAEEDSDGDGVPNILELLSGHNPGDAADKPTDAELAKARVALTEFRQKKANTYAWRPFQPVARPAVPALALGWGRNPVDAFLGAEYARHSLTPPAEAPKAALLRRVTLDLTGLPPTRDELHAFLDDPSPDAYEKVVDRLLASPRYGERWARHWMDVWRYSDWGGFGNEVRESQRHIWHWRDWIVECLNADKGYDRMVLEMLAADELAPGDASTMRATGFLARNWFVFNRNVWLDTTVEHTGKAFLGVTLNCARCHDHFFDPIGQKEYYSFRAIFEPYQVRTDRIPGVASTLVDGMPRVYDGEPTTPTYLFVRGDDKNPDKEHPLPPQVPSALGGIKYEPRPISLPLTESVPDKRPFVVAETIAASAKAAQWARVGLGPARKAGALAVASLAEASPFLAAAGLTEVVRQTEAQQVAEAAAAVAAARHAALIAVLATERLEDAGQKGTPEWEGAATAAALVQHQASVLEARHRVLEARHSANKGEPILVAAATGAAAFTNDAPAKKLAEAEAALAKAEAALTEPPTTAYTARAINRYPATSTGRRLALARWITDPQNPLAARVTANHIWLRHFGKGIVPTEFDFGKNGQPPTHPALLDWLAAELMDHDWSMKHLHRLIVTSAAYRMTSASSPSNAAVDPDNVWIWHMRPRRLEAEAVRDSVLAVAGQLDLTAGGPDIDYKLGLSVRRRSLYFRHGPEKEMEFLALFDSANVTECYRRSESVVPQQALALANSPLTLAMGRTLAGNLVKESAEPDAFIFAAFEQVLSRPPTDAETAECRKFLTEQAALLSDPQKLLAFSAGPASQVAPSPDPAQRARENLVHVLMNHTDFVTMR
jgi:Protein of unknown function (DUF1553)/Protein of unknown function (DUF1549)